MCIESKTKAKQSKKNEEKLEQSKKTKGGLDGLCFYIECRPLSAGQLSLFPFFFGLKAVWKSVRK